MIGRRAGTVSCSSASYRTSTRRSASSGSSFCTGSSRSIRSSSTRVIAAAARIGLVSDATRNGVSRRIGSSPPNLVTPIVSTSTWSSRATSVTMPGNSPR